MKTNRVTVLPYDKAWKSAFEQIKGELEAALGEQILTVEHVGSTSVEGMSAKPCIDIDVVIEDAAQLGEVIKRLASIGYVHEGDLGIKDREAFRYENKPHLMKHHLYVCPKDSEELRRHLRFREFLKRTPEAAETYRRVKEQAALLFADDIDGYMAYKSPCIQRLYEMCGLSS